MGRSRFVSLARLLVVGVISLALTITLPVANDIIGADVAMDTTHVSTVTQEVITAQDVVRVHHHLTIANPQGDEREHLVDLTLPDTAAVDRFGMWVQGRYLEGEIAPRALGRRLYQEVSGLDNRQALKRDPALLTWEGPGHYRLRVFPVPAHGEVRVLLSYVAPRLTGVALTLPSVLAPSAARAASVSDVARTIPGMPALAGRPFVHAFAGVAGEPGYFLAVLPLPTWQGRPMEPDLEIIIRDTSRRMQGRYAVGSSLQRELASRVGVKRRCFLLDADVVPQPIIALDAVSAAREPTYGGLFDLAAAFQAVDEFIARHAGSTVRLTMLGEVEADGGAALTMPPVLPTVLGGQVTLSCTSSPRWLAGVAGALIDDHTFTDLAITSAAGISGIAPAWMARAPVAGQLLVFGRWTHPHGSLRVTARSPDGSTISHDYVLDFQADAEATYLPRLWAAQQIHSLATTISVEGENTERAQQQQELARRYQVLGPLSSFVVLSNERDYRANALERAARISGWAEAVTTRITPEPAFEAWPSQSGVGSRLMPPEPPATGLNLHALWKTVFTRESRFDVQELELAYLYRDSEAAWGYGRETTVRTPLAGWARVIPAAAPIPPQLSAWWGERVAAMESEIDGIRWRWWRDGEVAVLQRLAVDGQPDWCVVIDGDGIRTALLEWGVWWRHAPENLILINRLLCVAPSPRWLPLSWLSRHLHIDQQQRDGATRLTFTSKMPQSAWVWNVTDFGYFFLGDSTEPSLHWSGDPRRGYDVITFSTNGEVVTALDNDGLRRQALMRPVPGAQRLPFPPDHLTIGVIDPEPLWQRIRSGAGTVADHWQLALMAQLDAEALPWLERAQAQQPLHPGIMLHVASVLAAAGQTPRAQEILRRLDALELPAWQRRGFAERRSGLSTVLAPSAVTGEPASATTPPSHNYRSWPTPWERQYSQPTDHETFKRQVHEALMTVQPQELDRLVRLSPWPGFRGLPASEGLPRRSILATVFGSGKEPAHWPAEAARELLARLEVDVLGQWIINQALDEDGEVILAYVMNALRDPHRHSLARALLTNDYSNWVRGSEAWRQRLTLLVAEPYPPAVRALASARLLRDFPWCFATDAMGRRTVREHLTAIGSVAVRMRTLVDCLRLCRRVNEDAAGDWDALFDDWKSLRDPQTYAATQSVVVEGISTVLKTTIEQHQRAELAGVMQRLRDLPLGQGIDLASGALRPLVVQACRQAAATGERAAAVAVVERHFAALPEPGLLAALARASAQELALTSSAWNGEIGQTTTEQSAPLHWWPEWSEDAATLAQRVLGSGGALPDERVWLITRERGIGRALATACADAFPEHALALWWSTLATPTDAVTATRALAVVRAVRQQLGNSTFAGVEAIRVALVNNLLDEAVREIDGLLAITPDDPTLRDLHLVASVLLGDGAAGDTAARALLARDPTPAHAGQAYGRIVWLFTLAHRYQRAFTFRQEALARLERLRMDGAKAGPIPEEWRWLSHIDEALLNEVVVPPGTVLVPVDDQLPEQAQVVSQAALGRYQDLAAQAIAGFATATDEQRYAWFSGLWLIHEQRLAAPCPPLSTWLTAQVAAGAALPADLTEEILLVVPPNDLGLWLEYAQRCRASGAFDEVRHLVWRIQRLVENRRDVAGLMALCAFENQPLPRTESWLWRANSPPPAFDDHLAAVAVADAKLLLAGAYVDFRDEERAWISAHPECRRQIDAVADAALIERPDDSLLAARCVGLGWGTQSGEVLWQRLVKDPLATVKPFADETMNQQVRCPFVQQLITREAWPELVSVLRLYQRAGVSAGNLPRLMTTEKVLATAHASGATEIAHTLAALTHDGNWLIAHGVVDPVRHPDWHEVDDDPWLTRADPARLLAVAAQRLADPFLSAYERQRCHLWRFSAHLWNGEHPQALAALGTMVEDTRRTPANAWDGSSTFAFRLDEENTGHEINRAWMEIRARLRDDWFKIHGVIDEDEQTRAHLAEFDRRCLAFLAHCAQAPAAQIPPLALLLALGRGIGGNSTLTPEAIATGLYDYAAVLDRCRDHGLGEFVRAWMSDGPPSVFIETPSAALLPAYAAFWIHFSHLTGRPHWDQQSLLEWDVVWRALPRGQQHDLLRQVSELALLPRADALWPEVRSWSSFEALLQDPFQACVAAGLIDPELVKPPDANQIPSPAAWLVREASRRAPVADAAR